MILFGKAISGALSILELMFETIKILWRNNLLFMKVKKLLELVDKLHMSSEDVKKKMDYAKTLAIKPDDMNIEVWVNHAGQNPKINIDQVFYADWRKMKMVGVRLMISRSEIIRIDLVEIES